MTDSPLLRRWKRDSAGDVQNPNTCGRILSSNCALTSRSVGFNCYTRFGVIQKTAMKCINPKTNHYENLPLFNRDSVGPFGQLAPGNCSGYGLHLSRPARRRRDCGDWNLRPQV